MRMSVSVDGERIKDFCTKKGLATDVAIGKVVGLSGSGVSKALSRNTLTPASLKLLLQYFDIDDENFFSLEATKVIEKKEEENYSITRRLDMISEKLDRLEYINRNICELIDVMEQFIDLYK